MTALFLALMHLARLRWLGAAFWALAMLCVTAHASAIAGATAHARIDVSASADTAPTASATELSQTKTRVWVFEQNSPLHVWSLRSASAETHRGISPTQSETASGPPYAARGGVPGLSISEQGGAIWAKVAGDPKAFARIAQEPGALHVTDIFRGAQGPGSGSQILAAGLKAGGMSPGQQLVFKGIINPETLATYKAGGSAAESLLGRLGSKTLGQMGMEASSFEFQMVRGKLDLVIGVK